MGFLTALNVHKPVVKHPLKDPWLIPTIYVSLMLLSYTLSKSDNCFCNKLYWLVPFSGQSVDKGVAAIKLGWKEYMQQPVLPASLAYVLLYFNVVLTPGSLMTAYLTQSGICHTFSPFICIFQERPSFSINSSPRFWGHAIARPKSISSTCI